MSPNIRRFLPLILIGLVVLIVVPSIFKKHSGPSTNTRFDQTIGALQTIDKAEQKRFAADGRYTGHLADLFVQGNGLATAVALPLSVTLDASADGKAYAVQIEGTLLSLVRARRAGKLVADTCLVVSGSVKCPPPAAT